MKTANKIHDANAGNHACAGVGGGAADAACHGEKCSRPQLHQKEGTVVKEHYRSVVS